MEDTKAYESFPVGVAILCYLVGLLTYAVGAYVLAGFGVLASILYLLYCLWMEVRLLRVGCVDCYYYGKVCGLGRGRVCSLLFRKGDPQRFVEKQVSWADMLPDFLVVILPIVGGIVLLVRDFTWLGLVALVVLGILYFAGNAVVRGSFACKYCKQGQIGCPALELFGGKSDG
jgi:hypothetical protein